MGIALHEVTATDAPPGGCGEGMHVTHVDMTRTKRTWKLGTVLTTVGLLAAGALVPASAADPSEVGRFSEPFTEPVIYDFEYGEDGSKEQAGEPTQTEDRCIESPRDDDGNRVICKPAAGSLALLPDGRILYWSALEATENIEMGTVPEFGLVAENDQSRVLTLNHDDLAQSTWELAFPNDGGATNPDKLPLLDGALIDNGGETNADGALFGADQVFLADGRLLAASGTDYYNEFGATELEGLRASRTFDYRTDSWEATGPLNIGRWYPTLVTLPNGDVLTFSGVTKLIKPLYADESPTDSGTNVLQPEVFDLETETWTTLADSANRSLPLYPRMRLLPNGEVFYDTAGQTWDPAGYSYSEAVWNIAASFDPETQTWNEYGVPGMDGSTGADLAYRGSGSTVMLPLRPDEDGGYTTVELLNSGGHPGTSPGTYVGQAFTRITSIALDGEDGPATVSHRSAGDLNETRWYGHSTLLPTGEVFLTSGGDVDHVIAPGSERPRTVPELFDPETETWTQVAEQGQERTYHNSAMLLPDATVLVGGHNPIPTGYGSHMTIPGNAPNDGRDPSFEIYEPPYLFRGERPEILDVRETVGLGDPVDVTLSDPLALDEIHSIVLVRNRAETHLIDGDQRTVELPVERIEGNRVRVRTPDNGNVLPPGPYMLFVNAATEDGPVPSEAAMLSVQVGDTGDIVGTADVEQTVVDEAASMIGADAAPVEPAPATTTGLASGSLVAMAAAAAVALRRRAGRGVAG